MRSRFQEYLKATESKTASPSLQKALSILRKQGKALDLGCGAGRDTRFLLEQGFLVTAVDQEPSVRQFLQTLPHQEKLTIKIQPIQQFSFEAYDLINAQFVLPFIPRSEFRALFDKLSMAINPNGVFVGQLFGLKDEWNNQQDNMIFHSAYTIIKLFKNYRIIELSEVEKDGVTATGIQKHWHFFNIIMQKR